MNNQKILCACVFTYNLCADITLLVLSASDQARGAAQTVPPSNKGHQVTPRSYARTVVPVRTGGQNVNVGISASMQRPHGHL